MRTSPILYAASLLALSACSVRDGGVKPGDGCVGNWECTDNHSCAGGHCLQDCGAGFPPCDAFLQHCDNLRDASGKSTSSETVCQPGRTPDSPSSSTTTGGTSSTTTGSGGGGSTTGGGFCCKHCDSSKPCGDTCIPSQDTCHTFGGCACF